jgi:hypothetical protein
MRRVAGNWVERTSFFFRRLRNQIRLPQQGHGASHVGDDGSMRTIDLQMGHLPRSPSGVLDDGSISSPLCEIFAI